MGLCTVHLHQPVYTSDLLWFWVCGLNHLQLWYFPDSGLHTNRTQNKADKLVILVEFMALM